MDLKIKYKVDSFNKIVWEALLEKNIIENAE